MGVTTRVSTNTVGEHLGRGIFGLNDAFFVVVVFESLQSKTTTTNTTILREEVWVTTATHANKPSQKLMHRFHRNPFLQRKKKQHSNKHSASLLSS
jgi:CO dehydrogenase nickel-insertion accessory protein CooC1